MYVLQNVECICRLGIVVFYVTYVLTVPNCQVSTGLAYVHLVACFTGHFVKPIHKSSMLIPCEQLLIQTFHQNGTLSPKQNCSEQTPLFLLAIEHSFT
jgi:Na+/melibiose symporter-like transporter